MSKKRHPSGREIGREIVDARIRDVALAAEVLRARLQNKCVMHFDGFLSQAKSAEFAILNDVFRRRACLPFSSDGIPIVEAIIDVLELIPKTSISARRKKTD